MFWIRLSLLGLLLLGVVACGSRHGDDPPLGDAVAIDFVNESHTAVQVYLNNDFAGAVEASANDSFILPAGTYTVDLDSGPGRLFHFQFVGLRPGQRTLMIYR